MQNLRQRNSQLTALQFSIFYLCKPDPNIYGEVIIKWLVDDVDHLDNLAGDEDKSSGRAMSRT